MTETTILAAYGLLVMLTILLQVLGGAQQLSLGYLLSVSYTHLTLPTIYSV